MNRSHSLQFCCYEIESTTDDKQEENSPLNSEEASVPMLSMDTNSKIKFNNVTRPNNQPIHELLLDLYRQENSQGRRNEIFKLLAKKRINPDLNWEGQREDLQYYIPQLVTFLVIERNLEDLNLLQIILDACTTDFYFAHLVYFYLNSLTRNWMEEPIISVLEFLQSQFLPQMNIYCRNRLSGIQFTKGMISHEKHIDPSSLERKKPQEVIQEITYGTRNYPDPLPQLPPPVKNFTKKQYHPNGFMETPSFWNDLVTIGEDISSVVPSQRNSVLDHLIKTRVNEKLPASVYVPFFKDKTRMYTVLCVWKGRIFSTKERAPFSIWVEMYREEEELELIEQAVEKDMRSMKCPKEEKKQKVLSRIYQTLSKPFNIADSRNTINIKKYIKDKMDPRKQVSSSQKNRQERYKYSSTFYQPSSLNKPEQRFSLSFVYNSQSQEEKKQASQSSEVESEKDKVDKIYDHSDFDSYFPPKATLQIEEIKRHSVYRQLKSWKVVHLMVKTGDDLKQEQFAMQLINTFEQIFKREKVECAVFPYEVVSLGPNYGIIQMLQDVTTFDSLFRALQDRNMTLKEFFESYFPDRSRAKKNFMRSLAGYCLITYFLQVKDRHNGNILLNREGYMMHIDFGFFLSNMPGKGVELEKNVPFKLLTSYVEVIGSLNSESFFEFRRLFYKGFSAIIKHRAGILSVVRMMYSSHGESMGCFSKSEQAVVELEKRLIPQGNVEQFCYELINNSLDNWRSKWYDKFQYFLQKIYY